MSADRFAAGSGALDAGELFEGGTAAAGGDPIEAPAHLGDLIDARSRKLLARASEDLGIGLALVDGDGKIVAAGGPAAPVPPPAQLAAATATLDEAPADGGGRWLLQAIFGLDGADRVGTLALGPLPSFGDGEAHRAATHLAHLVDCLVSAGLEKLLAGRMHSASIEDAYHELEQKNARLASAVERLQEVDKVKSSFLATVSHELRTPLTSVIGYSEMLLEGLAGPLNGEQSEYVRTVMEKGEQLLAIIQGILDISRVEAGGVQLDRSRFPIAKSIEEALTSVVPTARRKKLELRKRVPSELPLVEADRDKVRQVLVNLVGNAVKFTPEGGKVEVTVDVAPLRRPLPKDALTLAAGPEEEKRAVRIAVRDSGIGIPPDALGKIFDPFYQVDSSSTRQFGGTGLGLAIVKSFVHAHGGSVWVESAPGQGSTFFVTLPVAA